MNILTILIESDIQRTRCRAAIWIAGQQVQDVLNPWPELSALGDGINHQRILRDRQGQVGGFIVQRQVGHGRLQVKTPQASLQVAAHQVAGQVELELKVAGLIRCALQREQVAALDVKGISFHQHLPARHRLAEEIIGAQGYPNVLARQVEGAFGNHFDRELRQDVIFHRHRLLRSSIPQRGRDLVIPAVNLAGKLKIHRRHPEIRGDHRLPENFIALAIRDHHF